MTFSRMKPKTTFMKARSLAAYSSERFDETSDSASGGGLVSKRSEMSLDPESAGAKFGAPASWTAVTKRSEVTALAPKRSDSVERLKRAHYNPKAANPQAPSPQSKTWRLHRRFTETTSLCQALRSFWPLKPALALLLAAVFVFQTSSFAAATSSAQPPDQMSYQGYLVDSNGVPLGNANPVNYDIVFQIYDSSQQGTLLWAEKQTVVFDKGQFAVVLGEGAVSDNDPRPNLSGVFLNASASDRYVQITVKNLNGTDAEQRCQRGSLDNRWRQCQ